MAESPTRAPTLSVFSLASLFSLSVFSLANRFQVRLHQGCSVRAVLFGPRRNEVYNSWLIRLVKVNVGTHRCFREIIVQCQLVNLETLLLSESILEVCFPDSLASCSLLS